MTILETFIKLRDDLKTWVTNNLNQKANISYVDEKFAAVPEFDPTEIQEAIDANTTAIDTKVDKVDGKGLSTNDYTTAEKDKLSTVEPNANFYEHPTHAAHNSALYKVTVDGSGHVSGATLAEKEDIVALGIPAQDTTYEEEISDLSDRIDDVENSINTTNETLEGVAQEFENYKTTNNEAVATNASGIEANKTAIEAIQGDYLKSTDKTQLQDDISKVSEKATANASAIEKLNGEGNGSVKQSIDNAFNEFAAKVSDDKVVNTYKELIDYAAEHGSEFTELVGKVDDVDKHVGDVETALSNYKTEVSEQFTEVDTTITDHSSNTNNPHNVTKEQIGLGNVDNTSDFEKPISYATEIALEGKSDKGHNHDDLYYDKDETLGLITVEDIDDICALDYSGGESLDPVTAATKYWVERYYQPKGDYLTASDITAHNVSTSSHSDIRLRIEEIADDFYTFADCDDETLSQLQEVVNYIKNNASLIEGVTTSKVNVSDIINNLTTNASNKPLSAAQGVVLKALIDAIVLPTKVSELENDSGYLQSYIETDPTVPAWAKEPNKPTYTASEVGALSADTVIPIVPTNVSAFTNDAGYLTKHQSLDGLATEDYVDDKIAAIPTPDVSDQINTHNTNTSAHNDIRNLISDLTTRLNTLANSNDTTLDQMSEVVAYIKSNKSLIDSITTSKVNVADIVDDLTTNASNKPLSAARGVAIKGLIDVLQAEVDGKSDEDHTHNYAGSSSVGGSANSAVKLDTSAGSATQPVYFSNGKPVATTYTLGASVPSDAKFTDTTYDVATTTTAGLMSAADKVKLDGLNGAAGVSSWNDLTDKPVVFSGGDTLTWDGNTDGLVSVMDMLYKVTDSVPTLADFANGYTISTYEGFDNQHFDATYVFDMGHGAISGYGGFFICVPQDAVGVDFDGTTFDEAGTYLTVGDGSFITSLIIPGYTGFGKEVLKPEVLPEHSHKWNDIEDRPFGDVPGDTLNWDGAWNANELVGMSFIHISDAVPTVDDVANGVLLDFGETIEITGEEIQAYFAEDGFCNLELLFIVIPQDNYAIDLFGDGGVLFPKAGVYTVFDLPYLTITIPNYSGFVKTDKIDEKYLPEMDWVEQTTVYVGTDADGVVRIYKNEELTEMLTLVELFVLINDRKRVVVHTSQNTQSYALYLSCADNCIIYITYKDKTAHYNIAYVAEYTP